MELKTVRPARRDSYEYAFRMTGLNRALTDWRRKPHGEPATALREPLLERAIGVVYRPETEYLSHYFEAVLSEQFDAHVRLCVQRRLACSAGERPAGARVRSPVVWIAGWRETEDSEAYRQRLPRGDDEPPGRNESERECGLENA